MENINITHKDTEAFWVGAFKEHNLRRNGRRQPNTTQNPKRRLKILHIGKMEGDVVEILYRRRNKRPAAKFQYYRIQDQRKREKGGLGEEAVAGLSVRDC